MRNELPACRSPRMRNVCTVLLPITMPQRINIPYYPLKKILLLKLLQPSAPSRPIQTPLDAHSKTRAKLRVQRLTNRLIVVVPARALLVVGRFIWKRYPWRILEELHAEAFGDVPCDVTC